MVISVAAATKVLGGIQKFMKSTAKHAANLKIVESAIPNIADFLSGLTQPFDQVKESMVDLGLVASEGFDEMATDISNAVLSLEPIVQDMADWFGDLYGSIKDRNWDEVRETISSGLTNAWEGIVNFFSDGERIKDLADFGASIINGIGNFFAETTPEDWNAIYEGISTGLKTFIDGVDWGDVFSELVEAWFNVMTIMTEIMIEVFTAPFDEDSTFFEDIYDKLRELRVIG